MRPPHNQTSGPHNTMTDTQAQEAARLAEALNKAAPWADGHVNHEAAALLRSQAARIAELEKAHAIAVEIGAQYAADREALAAELARMREPLSDERIEQLASLLKPITQTDHPSWEHAVCRAYEAARGITKTGEQK